LTREDRWQHRRPPPRFSNGDLDPASYPSRAELILSDALRNNPTTDFNADRDHEYQQGQPHQHLPGSLGLGLLSHGLCSHTDLVEDYLGRLHHAHIKGSELAVLSRGLVVAHRVDHLFDRVGRIAEKRYTPLIFIETS